MTQTKPPCIPQSLHWLGDRVDAEETHHHPDMRGLVMYFERQSDCLLFMRWMEGLANGEEIGGRGK